MLLKPVLSLLPSVLAPATITIATTAAMRPYSRAVTPRLSDLIPSQVLTIFTKTASFTNLPIQQAAAGSGYGPIRDKFRLLRDSSPAYPRSAGNCCVSNDS